MSLQEKLLPQSPQKIEFTSALVQMEKKYQAMK